MKKSISKLLLSIFVCLISLGYSFSSEAGVAAYCGPTTQSVASNSDLKVPVYLFSKENVGRMSVSRSELRLKGSLASNFKILLQDVNLKTANLIVYDEVAKQNLSLAFDFSTCDIDSRGLLKITRLNEALEPVVLSGIGVYANSFICSCNFD